MFGFFSVFSENMISENSENQFSVVVICYPYYTISEKKINSFRNFENIFPKFRKVVFRNFGKADDFPFRLLNFRRPDFSTGIFSRLFLNLFSGIFSRCFFTIFFLEFFRKFFSGKFFLDF